MGKGIPRAGVLRGNLTGLRSWRKVRSGAAEKGALPAAVWGGGREGHPALGAGGSFSPSKVLTLRLRPRRKCPERWRSRPIRAGLGDVGEGRSLLGAGGGSGGRARHLGVGGVACPARVRVSGVRDAGQGSGTDSFPQHTQVWKVNYSLSWRGGASHRRGAGAEEAPGPLRKGAV